MEGAPMSHSKFFRPLWFTFFLTFVVATPWGSLQAQDVPPAAEAKQETETAKPEPPKAYEFTDVIRLDHTPVKSQDATGTCWSFATTSFLESEMLREGKGLLNLSEMYVVRNIYTDKCKNYLLRQGKATFGQGALAHDLIGGVKKYGIVPEEIYSGLLPGQTRHNHSELETVLKGLMDTFVAMKTPSKKWTEVVESVLDTYMGPAPKEFSFQGRDYTPQSFAAELGFDANDYVNLTSFTHHAFGDSFALEIPDNFSNGAFQNVPIDDLVNTIDRALEAGYTIAWDGDVSERGFQQNNGIAVLPDPSSKNFSQAPGPELNVTQEMRQETFENFTTTDDHLMHLVGTAKDQLGNKYYIIKNSWGETGSQNGYLYMSEAYVRLKTISILVHKDIMQKDGKSSASAQPEASSKSGT
jgi:bleomycin hydrolase